MIPLSPITCVTASLHKGAPEPYHEGGMFLWLKASLEGDPTDAAIIAEPPCVSGLFLFSLQIVRVAIGKGNVRGCVPVACGLRTSQYA